MLKIHLFKLESGVWITEVYYVHQISTESVQYVRSKLSMTDGHRTSGPIRIPFNSDERSPNNIVQVN